MTVALPGFVFLQGARHQQVTGKMKLFLPNRAKLVPKSVNTIVMIDIYNQYVGLADDQLVKDLDEAVNAGYVYSIDPEDFVSLRNGNFPLTSTSMAEGRFNQQGSAAFYTASGECCARTEVPASEDRELQSQRLRPPAFLRLSRPSAPSCHR